MKATVKAELRTAVSQAVRTVAQFSPSVLDLQGSLNLRGLLPDIRHFQRQMALESPPPTVAHLTDGDDGAHLKVLLRVPDLDNPLLSHEMLRRMLEISRIVLEPVTRDQATEIFIDRMSEYLTVLQMVSTTSGLTDVTSNRTGDTLLYALGYFVSTGTAFGISRASVHLSPGRYSFGIIDGGTHRFQPTVWSCPTTVHVSLP
jgi:hypothetical protein